MSDRMPQTRAVLQVRGGRASPRTWRQSCTLGRRTRPQMWCGARPSVTECALCCPLAPSHPPYRDIARLQACASPGGLSLQPTRLVGAAQEPLDTAPASRFFIQSDSKAGTCHSSAARMLRSSQYHRPSTLSSPAVSAIARVSLPCIPGGSLMAALVGGGAVNTIVRGFMFSRSRLVDPSKD